MLDTVQRGLIRCPCDDKDYKDSPMQSYTTQFTPGTLCIIFLESSEGNHRRFDKISQDEFCCKLLNCIHSDFGRVL
jgi:hypothetical protein